MDNTQANIKSFNTRLWLSGGRDQTPEGAMRRCINAAPELTGSVYSRYGSVLLYPIGSISLTKFNGIRYQYDGSKLYRNGVTIDTGYNGNRLSFVKMPPQIGDPDYLFVTGGGKVLKINSAGAITNWGIDAPPNSVQINNLANDQIVIDTFDSSASSWTPRTRCSVSNDTTDPIVGTGSLKITPSDIAWRIYRNVSTLNLGTYSNGDISLPTDIFQCWVQYTIAGGTTLFFDFDVNDGTFTDFYRIVFDLVPPGITNRIPATAAPADVTIVLQTGEWRQITWAKSQMRRIGANFQYDWANVQRIRIGGSGGTNYVLLDNFTLSGGAALGAGPAAGNGGSEYDYTVVFRNLTTGSQSNGQDNPSKVFAVSVNKTQLNNIPVSSDPQVTARDLYRTTALNQPGGGISFYLDTIYDNTTTTYIDAVADSSIPETQTPWQASVNVPPNPAAPYYIDAGNGYYFKLTAAGTTGATPPQWKIPSAIWSPISIFLVGDTTSQPRANGVFWQVTTAGTSGIVEPNWNQAGPITDGTVVWTSQGLQVTADNSVQWTFQGINSTLTLGSQKLLYDNAPPHAAYQDAVGPFQGTMFWCRDTTTGAKGRVYFSPPGRPESVEDFIVVSSDDDPTQKLVIWDENLYVLTTQRVYPIFSETLTDGTITWTAGDPILGARGTNAPFSVVSNPTGVTYQGPDGPRFFTNGGNGLVAFDALSPTFRGQLEENVAPFNAVIAAQTRGEILWSDTTIGFGLISPLEQLFSQPVWRMIKLPFTAITYESDDDTIVASWGGNTYAYEVKGTFTDGSPSGGGGGVGPLVLLIASGNNNIILTSIDGITWTTVHAPDASSNTLVDQAWDGGSNFVILGGSQIWSSTNGGVTFTQRTIPANTGFGLITDPTGVGKLVIWDGAQFVCVGWVNSGGGALQGVVGTSPDGVTWTWANVADSFNPYAIALLNGRYVILDFRNFHSPAQATRFYSATSPLGTWTLEFTSALSNRYAWLGSAPAGFIAFGGGTSTQTFIAYSADGINWSENASGMAVIFERDQVYYDATTQNWVIAGVLANGNGGIATTPTGAVLTTRLDQGAFTGGGALLRGAGNVLFAAMGSPSPSLTDTLYQSTDNGVTWTLVGSEGTAPSLDLKDVVYTGSIYVALETDLTTPFSHGLSTSPNLLSPWTLQFDDTTDANVLILRGYNTTVPPPSAFSTIPIEWQTPSVRVNEGQFALVQRVFIDINCNGQVLTPTLLVDESLTPAEYPMPNITNTARGAIEIPFQRKAKILGVRLTGDTQERVEWFGVALDIRPTQP